MLAITPNGNAASSDSSLILRVNPVRPQSRPLRSQSFRTSSTSKQRDDYNRWSFKTIRDRVPTPIHKLNSDESEITEPSPREPTMLALDQVMKINVNNFTVPPPSEVTPQIPHRNYFKANRSKKHDTTPREPETDFHDDLIVMNTKVSQDLLRGSEVEIASQYSQRRAMITPPAQNIKPFPDSRMTVEERYNSWNRSATELQMPPWQQNSSMRNMAGTQNHYLLYMRKLRAQQDLDRDIQAKKVDSSVQRIQHSKQMRTANVSNNSAPKTTERKHLQMCNLPETWDIKDTQGPPKKSPMDISNRKNEFSREVSFIQQRKQQGAIRNSATPRDDEGILDWLLRSVTSVPLDSKYAPRTTSRLFQLSVHALQNQLSHGDFSSQGENQKFNNCDRPVSGLYIDPQIRAKTAHTGTRHQNGLSSRNSFHGRARNVKSAAAAGRIDLNTGEDPDERIETSRKLWSAHHQHKYANRKKNIPQVEDADLEFERDVIREYMSLDDDLTQNGEELRVPEKEDTEDIPEYQNNE